ncbi:deoxyribodipyrimidine photo-lyase [Putridiphycobacter roseus]|uniref:Deoxyribodipyrimidine photo-lyase n=1 Tax=Putridiphycobacter roseus TaxID=2219161 RepID=A0A2W1N0M2_9FLAO|nr:deoxyribodipyrimidine photo-lyase [Putridiphycobacter roseus]PZE17070.1 deoxyribodipyrimidine photo-lyase [Putridiphycobacter roseus]
MIAYFWHRRDLRLEDNHGLSKLTQDYKEVIPMFIFDTTILSELSETDRRMSFIYDAVKDLKNAYQSIGSDLQVFYGDPVEIFNTLIKSNPVEAVYTNTDYEPYGITRDAAIQQILEQQNVLFQSFKDQVIFEKEEVSKVDGLYQVFTPYSRKWKSLLKELPTFNLKESGLKKKVEFHLPTLHDMGFSYQSQNKLHYNISESVLLNYAAQRDVPSLNGTSNLSTFLRFGIVSIRKVVTIAKNTSETFLNELIWREFYMAILWGYPNSVSQEFRPKYRQLNWENNVSYFKLWCAGKTGFPIVDAGMRELNATGLMHNRVRMITASFLVKDLCVDWRWGEAYFAEKLMDYELASNVGNWQWAAGTGTDAAPYFRVFNPDRQQEKFDPDFKYIKKWIPEFGTDAYPSEVVNHKEAREKILNFYKSQIIHA